MLVLSRKKNEKIVFTLEDGRRIEVMVVAVRGDKARLGSTCDASIEIHREEVQNAIDNGLSREEATEAAKQEKARLRPMLPARS